MVVYVLILSLVTPQGTAMTTATFLGETPCLQARDAATKEFAGTQINVRGVCVPQSQEGNRP
jgi:hypothetical protein